MRLLVEYVSTKYCVNLFRPSLKKKSFGVVCLTERLPNVAGIHIKRNFENSSQLVFNVCVRKSKNCCNNGEFLSRRF